MNGRRDEAYLGDGEVLALIPLGVAPDFVNHVATGSVTVIAGGAAKHAIITDDCREAHGEELAMDIAINEARWMLRRCVDGWVRGKGAKFHVVVTVEAPDA